MSGTFNFDINIISGIFLANSTPDYNLPLLMDRFDKEPLRSLLKHRFKKGEPTFHPEKLIRDDLYIADLESDVGSFMSPSTYTKVEDIISSKGLFDVVHKALFSVLSYTKCSSDIERIYIDGITRTVDLEGMLFKVPDKIDESKLSIVILDDFHNGYFLSVNRPKVADMFRHIPKKSSLIDLSDCERKHPFDNLSNNHHETLIWKWSTEPDYEFLHDKNKVKRSFLEGKQNIKKNRYIKGRQL